MINTTNITNTHVIKSHLVRPPIFIILVLKIFGFIGNTLNHRATRVIFNGNAIEVSIANSFVSLFMVLIILGFIEAYYAIFQPTRVNKFQGPFFITTSILIHPILLLNGFAEMGYTYGTAYVYKSYTGIVLKVIAAFVAAICIKPLLPVLGFGNSAVSNHIYIVSICFAISGVYFSLTERRCSTHTNILEHSESETGESETGESETGESNSPDFDSDEHELMLNSDKSHKPCEQSVHSEINTRYVGYTQYVGFFILVLANACWALFQIIFAREYAIDHIGYISLDQIYGRLTSIVFTAIITHMRQKWTENRTVHELFLTVIRKTFGSICKTPAAFLYLTISKLISNCMIVVYFILSTTYDPGLVLLEMSFIKVILGVVYTISVAFCCPIFLDMTEAELNEIKSVSYVIKRTIGIICIMSGLCLLK